MAFTKSNTKVSIGDIFLRLVKAEGSYELRNPIGYGVQVVKCKDLDEADTKASSKSLHLTT